MQTLHWKHGKLSNHQKYQIRGGIQKIMNFMSIGITIEIFLLIGVIFWIRKLKINKSRQPSLSKKIIKNLKFKDYYNHHEKFMRLIDENKVLETIG